MLVCCVCQESFNERNALEMHISSSHIYYNAYECEHCKTAKFPSNFALRLHYEVDHRQKVYYIKYRVSPELQKKKIVLERLLRISLQTSGGSNAIESTLNSGDVDEFVQNLDHMEVSQLLNYVNQSALAAQSTQQPSTSFSALSKFDLDEPEAVETLSNTTNTNTDVVSILEHNNQQQQQRINVSSQESNNIVYFPINSSYINGGNKAHDAAVQGLLSINNAGGHSLTPTITSSSGLSAVHQLQIHANLLQQSPQQHNQNGHHQQQQQLSTYTLNNNNESSSNNNHFSGIHVSTSNNNSDDGVLTNGASGQEILAKLMNQTVTKREKRNITRNGRVSSQIACNNCGHKVSNYMNSLVLHVSTHHCDDVVYECLGCNKKWFSLSARCKEHIKSRHDGDNSLLKDNRAKIMPMLKEKAAKFFPDHRFS